MPGRNKGYKPLVPTKGNFEKTTQDNIDRVFQILNRLEYRQDQLEAFYNSLVIVINTGDAEGKVWGVMMMDDD